MGKLLKFILYLTLFVLCVALFIFLFSWYNYNRGFTSVDSEFREQVFSGVTQSSIFSTDSGSIRRTGNTFMSIPEWYIVTLSSDYTKWLEEGKNPSDFPYFQYLSDMWYMYGRITAIMDGKIPRDYEYHTMVQVIGLSTTLEFSSKAVYEMTIGRLSSYFGYNTPEDLYYQEFSRKYVNFILLRPWYEFPFKESRKNFHLSEFQVRNIERFLINTIEFFLKEKYAKVIEDAAHSNFAVPNIWTTITGVYSKETVKSLGGRIEMTSTGMKIPRYYPFTEIFPEVLSENENTITSIAGNTHLVSEFLKTEIDENAFLSLPVPIEANIIRSYYFSDITTLKQMLMDPRSTLIHIYDF